MRIVIVVVVDVIRLDFAGGIMVITRRRSSSRRGRAIGGIPHVGIGQRWRSAHTASMMMMMMMMIMVVEVAGGDAGVGKQLRGQDGGVGFAVMRMMEMMRGVEGGRRRGRDADAGSGAAGILTHRRGCRRRRFAAQECQQLFATEMTTATTPSLHPHHQI